jgi:hypothetical protein
MALYKYCPKESQQRQAVLFCKKEPKNSRLFVVLMAHAAAGKAMP